MKAVRPVIASNGVSSLQLRSIGSPSTSGRKERRKKRNNSCCKIGKEKTISRDNRTQEEDISVSMFTLVSGVVKQREAMCELI